MSHPEPALELSNSPIALDCETGAISTNRSSWDERQLKKISHAQVALQLPRPYLNPHTSSIAYSHRLIDD